MDWKFIRKRAEAQGWRIIKGKRTSHLRWLSPDGKHTIISSGSPSDWRAIKNHIALLRKGGYDG